MMVLPDFMGVLSTTNLNLPLGGQILRGYDSGVVIPIISTYKGAIG